MQRSARYALYGHKVELVTLARQFLTTEADSPDIQGIVSACSWVCASVCLRQFCSRTLHPNYPACNLVQTRLQVS